MYETVGQDDWGGGIFRGRRAPADSVFDAVNALVNDERLLFRRGGSLYKSGSNADDTLLGLWDGHTSAGPRTVFWSDSSPYVLDSNDSSILDLGTVVPAPLASGVEIGGFVFFQGTAAVTEIVYAGSRKTAAYSTGTASAAAGSTTITGSGTSWLANVDAGMILRFGNNFAGVVRSVESDTSLTLVRPAPFTSGLGGYSLSPILEITVNSASAAGMVAAATTGFHAVAGGRLLRVRDNRVYFSRPMTDAGFFGALGVNYTGIIEDAATDFHELPRSALIIGADSIEDTAVLFTTEGVWTISNMAFDALDAVGNVQHQVQQVSQDVVLWGEAGIAARENVLVVPAVDDVYLLAPGQEPAPISAGIRPLYREYVEAGYKPGTAAAGRGHYELPILDGSNAIVDSLWCRLDGGAAWTRQANGAASRAYARRVGATTRSPKLLGLDGLRVSDLTGCFDPDATRKEDADGTDHKITVVTRDLDTGPGLQKNFVANARVEYELVDAASDNPTVSLSYAVGPEGAAFTSAGAAVRGGAEADGTDYSVWRIGRDAERIRIKIETNLAAASALLRRLELEVEQAGW